MPRWWRKFLCRHHGHKYITKFFYAAALYRERHCIRCENGSAAPFNGPMPSHEVVEAINVENTGMTWADYWERREARQKTEVQHER